MTEPDTMVDVYRRLALALEPDLVETRGSFDGAGWSHDNGPDGCMVRNERGLEVTSATPLGAWTAALEACQRRAAWRTMKAKRKLERSTPVHIGIDLGPPSIGFDDQPDGAA